MWCKLVCNVCNACMHVIYLMHFMSCMYFCNVCMHVRTHVCGCMYVCNVVYVCNVMRVTYLTYIHHMHAQIALHQIYTALHNFTLHISHTQMHQSYLYTRTHQTFNMHALNFIHATNIFITCTYPPNTYIIYTHAYFKKITCITSIHHVHTFYEYTNKPYAPA